MKELHYDVDNDGGFDTRSYMDGARILRIEIDQNDDGKIDRWEYYGADQKLEKVGLSRPNDGIEDAWWYPRPDGSVARIEVSMKRDGKANRVEYRDKNVLVRAEEDIDDDGRMDKWESYDGTRLASVSFDSTHRGTPDRRLMYEPDGSVRVEIDRAGGGHFVPADQATKSARP